MSELKHCSECQLEFPLEEEFIELLKNLSPVFAEQKFILPAPSKCPRCRYQQRIAHRNEWNLYRRKCDLSEKEMVSIYSEDKPFPVYAQEAWWGDDWDSRDFGQEFDFSRPFFGQFFELQQTVPRLAIVNTQSENSEFTNQCMQNRDCYLLACCSYNERCQYSQWVQNSTDCIDCYAVEKSERSYECVNGKNLYNCAYVFDSENCSEGWFSSDCKGCSYVFGCRGLRNKKFYLFNEEKNEEEWRAYFNSFQFSRSNIQKLLSHLSQEQQDIPRKYYRGKQNEDFSGDFLENCKQGFELFNCRDCWDVWYSQDAWRAKDSSDLTEILDVERCYQFEGAIGYGSLFCTKSWPLKFCLYSDLCFQSSNLFGCIGIRNGEYCVLNKQYGQAQYETLVARILTHMQETGEWGEHFPVSIAPFGYNETIANDYFPLTKEEILAHDWNWYEDPETRTSKGTAPIPVPEVIEEISDEILQQVLTCSKSGKSYKVNQQELTFYRELGVAVPSLSPEQRRLIRMDQRNPRLLWTRQCMNENALHTNKDLNGQCLNEFQTSYAPHRQEKVFCEECYLSQTYD